MTSNKKVCLIGEALIRRSDKKQFADAQMYSSPWFHWAVFANDTVYEVTGNIQMEVVDYDSTETEFRTDRTIFYTVNLTDTSISTPEEVKAFIAAWIRRNPKYSLIGANCQEFAKDFAKHFFGVILETQFNRYQALGRFFYEAFVSVVYAIIVASVVAVFFYLLYLILTWYGNLVSKQVTAHTD